MITKHFIICLCNGSGLPNYKRSDRLHYSSSTVWRRTRMRREHECFSQCRRVGTASTSRRVFLSGSPNCLLRGNQMRVKTDSRDGLRAVNGWIKNPVHGWMDR